MKARAKWIDGTMSDIDVVERKEENTVFAAPAECDWEKICYIDFGYDFAEAKVGDGGYYVMPRGGCSPDDHICAYEDRADGEVEMSNFQMTMFGYTHAAPNSNDYTGFCAVVTGYTYEYHVILGKKGQDYYCYVRFPIGGKAPYEPLSMEYTLLTGDDANYSGVARAYRTYMLTKGGATAIRDRLNPELAYAKDALYIRIRQAWKPVPSPIEEQTPENEPPIHVAIDFDRVGELMERCKAAGLEKAEFCLVGWNKSGHDGRWPQLFPVEPLLGGEKGLVRLIEKAKKLGYQITCHTNTTDSYSIADNYSPDIVRKNPDGSMAQHGGTWGGGRGKWVCPQKGYEIAVKEYPKLAELGFRGLNYIDVISTIALSPCYDPNHPMNRRQVADSFKAVAKLNHDLFGGFSSEGGYDHTVPYLDYGLYVSFFNTEGVLPAFFTKCVPIWQIAYHGIVMSNPYTSTVNSPIKSRKHQLEVIERGGRPTVYIYSKFLSSGNNWMGNDDIVCTTEEEMETTVQRLSDMYKEFEPLSYLQTVFIDRHEEKDGIAKTYYADGSIMTVDYNNGTYSLQKA